MIWFTELLGSTVSLNLFTNPTPLLLGISWPLSITAFFHLYVYLESYAFLTWNLLSFFSLHVWNASVLQPSPLLLNSLATKSTVSLFLSITSTPDFCGCSFGIYYMLPDAETPHLFCVAYVDLPSLWVTLRISVLLPLWDDRSLQGGYQLTWRRS